MSRFQRGWKHLYCRRRQSRNLETFTSKTFMCVTVHLNSNSHQIPILNKIHTQTPSDCLDHQHYVDSIFTNPLKWKHSDPLSPLISRSGSPRPSWLAAREGTALGCSSWPGWGGSWRCTSCPWSSAQGSTSPEQTGCSVCARLESRRLQIKVI